MEPSRSRRGGTSPGPPSTASSARPLSAWPRAEAACLLRNELPHREAIRRSFGPLARLTTRSERCGNMYRQMTPERASEPNEEGNSTMQKRMFLKTVLGAAMALGVSMGVAQAQDALARVKAASVLKVGTETAFAPFDFIDAGKHAGLNVDLFAEIGKEMGVKIEWVALPWEGVLPGLEAGKFDMVAGPATITKARME